MPTKFDAPDFCDRCYFHSGGCFCDSLEQVPSQLRWSIIMYKREFNLSSNTGRLAKNTLPNCEIYLRGIQDQPIDWENIIKEDEQNFVFFPSDDAIDITEVQLDPNKKVHIIVPDGSWNQAAQIPKREKPLGKIQKIKLPNEAYTSNYYLRKAPKPGYLCTYESMSKVVENWEGKELSKIMDKNLKELVKTSLKNRRHFSKTLLELDL